MHERRAKIVCTLGPSSNDPATIRGLIAAGMDVARLNFSHGTRDDHAARVAMLREASRELGRPVGILQDLQGPKLRVETPGGEPVNLVPGMACTLTTQLTRLAGLAPGAPHLAVSYAAFPRDVQVGDPVLLDDGLIRLQVESLDPGNDQVHARVIHGGLLKNRKGLNLPGAALSIDAITEKDRTDLRVGLELGVDFVAMSFVQRADDVRRLKAMIADAGHDTPVVAKIEKPQAVADLDAILQVADGIMVARGDLGVEMATEELPPLQKRIITACNRAGRPVITATQMLESMVTSPRPTRAEATDVANAIFDGTDAVMLSAETASGVHPITVVETMARIVTLAERSMLDAQEVALPTPDTRLDSPVAVSYSACQAARLMHARAIVALSIQGNIPRILSRYRPRAKIIAISSLESTARRCTLVWGVRGYVNTDFYDNLDQTTQGLRAMLLREGVLAPGDPFIITAGIPFANKVPTNALVIEIA